MKRHIKRLATPATWDIPRKEEKYIMRPNSGSQKMSLTLPLGVVLRMAGVANTLKEMKYLLSQGKILVDGKVRKDHKFGVGFLASVTVPEDNVFLRMTLTTKGTLSLVKIPEAESALKIARITDIRKCKKGYSTTLSDGRQMLSAKKPAETFSSVLFTLPDQETKEILPLTQGSLIFVIAGKHPGMTGKVKNIEKNNLTIQSNETAFTVNRESVIVIGKERPALKLG